AGLGDLEDDGHGTGFTGARGELGVDAQVRDGDVVLHAVGADDRDAHDVADLGGQLRVADAVDVAAHADELEALRADLADQGVLDGGGLVLREAGREGGGD